MGKRRMHKTGRKSIKGGSAWQWVQQQVGDINTQLSNTLGSNAATGSYIVPASGAQYSGVRPQHGGRRRRNKTRKGGFGILTKAAVPFTLAAAKYAYGQKYGSRKRSSTRRRRH